ncbi:hypothetical protein [Moraxella oblonga]|uniref:hypothetical protein n=1 Tax=Moraxella oblonga TaxID=200413 RepID=UPI00082E5647|nr:hypothetical protein [Moraxella oblonga]
MTQSASTNFDLTSLHLLRSEINIVLKDAEVHLREFYDDPEQASFLLDSANNLKQLASIFELIAFDGADLLSSNLSDCYTKLHSNLDGDEEENEHLMTDISEAVMLLDRYVEFVLLKEMPEPALLLPIINKLNTQLGKPTISADDLKQNSSSVIISDPASNYTSLSSLGLNTTALTQAYRAGLSIILNYKEGTVLFEPDRQKLDGMAKACALVAQKSDTLFWHAAATLTQNIGKDLPLSHPKKRILIYLEQQFGDYLPIEDRRFAELVSFACNKNANFASLATQKYSLNKISQAKFEEMQHFLFGPNREITDTLNELIQTQIEEIKQKVDTFVRAENDIGSNRPDINEIAGEIRALANTMSLLELNDASLALKSISTQIVSWQNPTLEDLDNFLDKLMVAENASIFLAKTHIPGAVKLPLHNREISLHQLDTAYETLVKEARSNISGISGIISTYIDDPNRDRMNLQNTPEMVRQVAGAAGFLRMPIAKQLYRLAHKLETDLLDLIHTANETQLAQLTSAWADVLVAADIELENFEQNRPSNKQTLLLSENSLNKILAA